jgi:hypothetical protein
MQCASSTTNSPIPRVIERNVCTWKRVFASRSGETRSRSTLSPARHCSSSSHREAFVLSMVAAWTPSIAAIRT